MAVNINIKDKMKKRLRVLVMASIKRRRPGATFTIENFVYMIPNSMDERTGRTTIVHTIETMRKNETCVSTGEKCLVKAGQLHCVKPTGKSVRRIMYRRTTPPLKESSFVESSSGDEQTVKKAKEKIVEVNRISIFQIGEAEEAIKASLRAGVRRYKVELQEFMIEFKNLEKVNTMLNVKVAELKEKICELEGNRAALSVSLIGDKSIAEIKNHINHPCDQ